MKKKKVLNILLLGTEFVNCCVIVIYLIFLITGHPIEGIEHTIRILITSIIVVIGGLIIFLINNYINNKLASSIFLIFISILIYVSDTPYELVWGRALLVLTLPIIMAGLVLKPSASLIVSFFIIIINILICFNVGFLPSFISLTVYILIAFITWFSLINLEQSIKKYREAYKRENFYKDLFAHDTNNILQNILLALELYMHEIKITDACDKRLTLYGILDQIYRGAHLVRNIWQFSKFTESKVVLKSVSFKKILEETIKNVKSRFERKVVNINVENLSQNIFVKVDGFLFVVFENILFNSVLHNDNKIVEISIIISKVQENGKKFLKVEFIDNGVGIPDSQKPYLFNRDLNEDKSHSGLGLGLSLIKNILNRYKAKIWVENRISEDYTKGSNFILMFPQVD
ncbi:MAG: sensor histidine kinase [Promethearchaeota archaeon]